MCQIEGLNKKAFPPAVAVRSLDLLPQLSLCEASFAHAFGKPRSLLPLHAFIAGLKSSFFQFPICIIKLSASFYFIRDTRDRNSARRAAYHW
jgi:hypothetical protein